MNKIYELNPQLLAQLYQQQRWTDLWRYIISVLEKTHGSRAEQAARKMVEEDYNDPEKRKFIVEFCKVFSEFIVIILNDENTVIDDDVFFDLLAFHEAIHTLFYIAGYSNTDEVVKKILGGDKRADASQQKKALLLLRLDTDLDLVSVLKNTMRKFQIPTIMAYLSYTRMDGGVHERKVEVLPLGEKVDGLTPHKKVFKLVSTAFFYVSFLYHPEKHRIKRSINRYVESFLKKFIVHDRKRLRDAKRIGEAQKSSSCRDKPLLLFYPEFFKKNHAMYRSWVRRIEQLKECFDVHLLIHKDEYDEEMQADYSNIHVCDNQSMNETIYLIYRLAPDILFFPSVGMTSPGMVLSNMRFCNIQVMGLGHPATAMSKHIDCVIGHRQYYCDAAFPMDNYIAEYMPPVFFPRKELKNMVFGAHENVNKKGCVEVAIVGTHFKLSAPFLSAVADMIEAAEFKVNLTFLVSGIGFGHVFLKNMLGDLFPQCTVKGFQEYNDYLDDLRKVDIMLSPFPFGHSNTIFDALLMGKPCVCLYGDEPHSRTDFVILEQAGLEDKFVANSIDEYKNLFFKLSREILSGQRDFFNPSDIYQKFCLEESEYDYAHAFSWIYENQDEIKRSDKKLFSTDF